MAKDQGKIDSLLNNVRELLPHVRDSVLDTKDKKLKATIEQQIKELSDGRITDMNSPSDGPDAIYEETDDYDALKQKVPVSDSTNVIYQGKLKYRKEKKRGNKSGYQISKRWCVLRNEIFYIYEKSSSKKQEECFFVRGYQVTPLEKEISKKNPIFPFEMIQENKKTYVFCALTENEQNEWVTVLNKATGIAPRDRPITELALYDDMDALITESNDPCSPSAESYPDSENLYDATVEGENIYEGTEGGENIYDGTEGGENIYDGTEGGENIYDGTEGGENIYDGTEGGENIYDGTEGGNDAAFEDNEQFYDVTAPEVPAGYELAKASSFPSSGADVEGAAVMEEPPVFNPDPGYADMYYGLLDNEPGYPQELGFKRGDIITILSRQYEKKGWWVGKLDGQIGLVPVSYMAPAFERLDA